MVNFYRLHRFGGFIRTCFSNYCGFLKFHGACSYSKNTNINSLCYTTLFSIMPPKRKTTKTKADAIETKNHIEDTVAESSSIKMEDKLTKKDATAKRGKRPTAKKEEKEPSDGSDVEKTEAIETKHHIEHTVAESSSSKIEDKPTKKDAATKRGKRPTAKKEEKQPSDKSDAEEVPKKHGKRPTAKKEEKEPSDESDNEEVPIKRGKHPTAKKEEREPSDESDAEEVPIKRGKRPTAKKEEKESSDESDAEEVPQKRGKRPTAKKEEKQPSDESDAEEVPKKRGKQNTAKPLKNKTETMYDGVSFTSDKLNKLGKTFNFSISSWNVDGLRAWVKKAGLEYLEREKPDVFCIQETKCSTEKLPAEIKEFDSYKQYWHNSAKEGYAGVGLFTRNEPISVKYGIGDEEQDEDGRCITAEFKNFFVISVYVPNAGRKLVTLPKRLEWNTAFKKFVTGLDKQKPVIICGDMNVAHSEVDLKNPKTNTKNAGFTKEERDGMTDFLSSGYVDTFRSLYPDKIDAYTFWTYMSNARAKNVGWRLDYFIASKRLLDAVCDNVIRSEVFGSDHCPIVLFINI